MLNKILTSYLIFTICINIVQNQNTEYPSFQEYTKIYGKVYDDEQYKMRQEIYNIAIQQLSQITDYTAAVNKFTDQTQEQRKGIQFLIKERKKLFEKSNITQKKIEISVQKRIGAPTSLDWNKKGKVTSIKDQGSCGSCWSFTAAAYGQSKLIIQKRQDINIDLSQQYLLSCTSQSSCDGGFLEYVYDEMASGVPHENDYPYNPYGVVSPFICWSLSKIYPGYIPKAGYGLTDNELQALLQVGPVGISISSVDWQKYGSGVFRCRSGASIDHAVLLVGYTQDYWIIKNQWGEDWGQNGYIRVTKSRSLNANCKIGYSAFILSQEYILVGIKVILFVILILI